MFRDMTMMFNAFQNNGSPCQALFENTRTNKTHDHGHGVGADAWPSYCFLGLSGSEKHMLQCELNFKAPKKTSSHTHFYA